MFSSKRVVFSYLNPKIAKGMTKEEAQKIVDKMDPTKVKKWVELIKKWLKFFKIDFNKKNADLYDLIGKISKRSGIPLIQLTALLTIFFGGIFPSTAGSPQESVKTEQGPATDYSKIRSEIERKIELPDKLERLVEDKKQGLINFMGMTGFLIAVKKYMSQSLTPEISSLLIQIPEKQWPEILSSTMMQKIKADPEVSVKFNNFTKHHKKTDSDMQSAIKKVVEKEESKIKKHVHNVAEIEKTAYERGYLIS